MNKAFILHAALLAGNFGLFLAMASGQGIFGLSGFHLATSASLYGAAAPNGAAIINNASTDRDLAESLASLRREQTQLREEIKRLQSPPNNFQAASMQPASIAGHCADAGDNAPGVTVYLDTTAAETAPTDSQAPTRQWTAVSFKEAGQAPDGSKQAVMSIHKTDVPANPAVPIPASTLHWQ